MSPLTYKVFNLYYFIRCGTYNSHLCTTTLILDLSPKRHLRPKGVHFLISPF
ncbi:hypothetical protein MtrunA17_Chr6g0485331 [Medicago truncatula]|uniref:Uncharacterized protein n=1 Tax=Medicago truncatula TaxID=3880 RepID=A0A396HJU4_MEDTR|nr:hypothetical protein MtrunA17_Chr6g0485331 [Medicago truncatula]